MVLAALVGIPLGSVAGVAIGSRLFPGKFKAKDYREDLDILGDDSFEATDDSEGKPVDNRRKALLKDLSPWLVQPDYQRTLFINHILTVLWPQLGPAVQKEVVKQAKQPLEDVKKQFPILEGVRIDELSLGSRPFRLDSIRPLVTQEDELILEAPMFWGGDLSVRVTASLKLGPVVLDIPLHLANVQLKALARITIKPLVEQLPCLGGVAISLMEDPHVDCELRLGPSPDLMALPGVPEAVKLAIKMFVGSQLGYPNQLLVPLMPNFGMPPEPEGMLTVQVIGATNLKSSMWDTVDPYVELQVREGRVKTTKTVMNNPNPTWEESFDFIVDSTASQTLSLTVMDDDLLSPDTVGVVEVPLAGADFIRRPRKPVLLSLPLVPKTKKKPTPSKSEEAAGQAADAAGQPSTSAGAAAAAAAAAADADAKAGGGSGSGSGAAPRSSIDAVTPVTPKAHPGSGGKGGRASLESVGGGATAESEPATPTGGPVPEHHSSFFGSLNPFRRKKKKGAAGGEAGASQSSSQEGADVAGEGAGATAAAALQSKPSFFSSWRSSSKRSVKNLGTVQLKVTYLPFKEAQPDQVMPPMPGASTETPAGAMQAAGRTQLLRKLTTVRRQSRGVLTVLIKKATGLEEGTCSYVTLSLYDPANNTTQEYKTPLVLREDAPRYNYKTDFVNISPKAVLRCVITSVPMGDGMVGAVAGVAKKLTMTSKKPKPVGSVRVEVGEVAKEGRIRDVWALRDAEAGDMHMTLEWKLIEFNVDALNED